MRDTFLSGGIVAFITIFVTVFGVLVVTIVILQIALAICKKLVRMKKIRPFVEQCDTNSD